MPRDTIGDAQSCEICAKVLSSDDDGGDYGCLQPVPAMLHAANPKNRGPFFTTAYVVCGETRSMIMSGRGVRRKSILGKCSGG